MSTFTAFQQEAIEARGNVIVSDMQGGLFVLDPSDALDLSCDATAAPAVGELPSRGNDISPFHRVIRA